MHENEISYNVSTCFLTVVRCFHATSYDKSFDNDVLCWFQAGGPVANHPLLTLPNSQHILFAHSTSFIRYSCIDLLLFFPSVFSSTYILFLSKRKTVRGLQ